jgi:sodium transport system ATP-binding protein
MVRTHEIGKDFPDPKKGVVRAVDRVTLVAHPGQIFGLLGANGAGKTTLLRMLSTVIEPTHGTAEVAGFDIRTQSREVRRSIGFLSASTALYGRLTARETLEYFAGLYDVTDKRRIDEIITQLGIGEFQDRLCDKLSTGQKQRVSIGRTILHNPPVLFFDEPTSGLDVLASQKVMEFVEQTRAQNKTVFYCTHIMSEAERLCDQIAIIHDGRLHAQGTVAAIREQTGEPSLEKAFLSIVTPLIGDKEAA